MVQARPIVRRACRARSEQVTEMSRDRGKDSQRNLIFWAIDTERGVSRNVHHLRRGAKDVSSPRLSGVSV